MPILNGHASAEGLPEDMATLMAEYSDALAAEALAQQSESGMPIDMMLAVVARLGGEETAGIMALRDVDDEFLDTFSNGPEHREAMVEFLKRPTPPTHIRAVFHCEGGTACVRLDLIPTPKAGQG